MATRVGDLFTRAFRPSDPVQLEPVIEAIRSVPLFSTLPRRMLRDLAEVVHVRAFRRDEFIYYERDPGLGLYIVQYGRVRLLVEDEAGGLSELRQAGEREIIGLPSLLGDLRRTETAQAVTETRLLGFFRPDLKTILRRNPATGAAVLELLGRELAVRQARLVSRLAERDGRIAAMRLVEAPAFD